MILFVRRIIDDDDPNMNKSAKSSLNVLNSKVILSNNKFTIGKRLPKYVVRDEKSLNFPRLLLARIQTNKRKIAEMEAVIGVLKRQYKKHTDRKLDATDSIETIDIS